MSDTEPTEDVPDNPEDGTPEDEELGEQQALET